MIKPKEANFVWDSHKEIINIRKHGVDFYTAALAFKDPQRKIFVDSKHSQKEERYFCLGKVNNRILTVRFVYRQEKIPVIGAGYWRKGAHYYDQA